MVEIDFWDKTVEDMKKCAAEVSKIENIDEIEALRKLSDDTYLNSLSARDGNLVKDILNVPAATRTIIMDMLARG